MITIKDVSKVFNAGKPNEFVAVNRVTLGIDSHKVTILKGPSGSGKTTLLGMIGCMARPTSGRIFLNEQEITSLPERFLTSIRRETFGFIFQQFNLIRGLTALENVMAPGYPTREKYFILRKKAQSVMNLLNIYHKADSKIEWLSGGEAQRVAISRALLNDPKIIIADEPTAHLDTKLSHEFMKIIQQLKDEGRTVILSSHDPIVYESILADAVVELRDGQLVTKEDLVLV